jgi:replicative DNA helicase
MKQVTPHNPEAEAAAIGCLLLGASPDVAPLREDHFFGSDHRLIFRTIRELVEASEPVTVQTVTARLTAAGQLENAGGPPARFLNMDAAIGQGESLLKFHAEHLEDARQNREAVLLINRHLADLSALKMPAPQFAEELAARCAPVATTAGKTAAEIVAEMEAELLRGESEETFPIGLRPLDDHLQGGLHRGELAVVAAQTGGGKTALMMQAAATAAKAGHPVVIFSLEITARDILRRIAAAASGISPNHSQFRSALCDATAFPIKIYDRTTDFAEIAATIRTAARHQKAALVIVDYLQLIEGSSEATREMALSETARRLKNAAQRENVVIVTASQLNDEGRLHSCRAIGHHANLVLSIGEDLIAIQKFRRGPQGVSFPCQLRGALSRLESL